MNCQLDVTTPEGRGHNRRASWKCTNQHGTVWLLCAGCVRFYKSKHPEWAKTPIRFEKLSREQIHPPHYPMSISYRP